MTWEWDASHFPVRVSRAMADLYPDAAERGFARGVERYGLGLSGWEVRVDDGWVFVRMLPGVPASLVERRERAARGALQGRRWLDDAERWRATERVEALTTLGCLGAVCLGELSTSELVDHLGQVADLVRSGVARHFELHLADMIPVGRLLLVASERSITADEVLARCARLSPASRLTHDAPGSTVIGRLDVDAPQIVDVGALVPEPPGRAQEAPPPWGDAELDRLLDEVAATFWLRDDNATILLAAPVGLLGRALREAAQRLDLSSSVLVEATTSEVVALLTGSRWPSSETLADRAAERGAGRGAPRRHPPPPAPDPPDGHPGPTSRSLTDALLAADALYAQETTHGVGSRTVTGRAVVATTPDEVLDQLGAGTVLIVRATSPAFDPALALVSAVVVETGGPLSHAALAARELGIPAIVGLKEAMTIPHGAWVEVDPVARTVRVVADDHP